MIALICTAGTAMGDYISKTPLPLTGPCLVDGAIFVGLIGYFYVVEKGNRSMPAALALPA